MVVPVISPVAGCIAGCVVVCCCHVVDCSVLFDVRMHLTQVF